MKGKRENETEIRRKRNKIRKKRDTTVTQRIDEQQESFDDFAGFRN